jgi:hypothetical protein
MVFGLPKLMCAVGLRGGVSGLRIPMVIWNLFLSIGSLWMLLGSLPIVEKTYHEGLKDGLCDESNFFLQKSAATFYTTVFVMSKFPELIDTLFLILKNPTRPVPFLHWYHHFTVLLFSWYTLRNVWSLGGVFAVVNATVHTVMYFYYFQMELGMKPGYALFVTIIQIVQMFMGIGMVSLWSYMVFVEGRPCSGSHQNAATMALACAIMYGSYLFLFLKFFVGRYFSTPRGQKPKIQ